MNLVQTDKILDLGGGKGDLSKALAEELRPKRKILCLDPNSTMLEQIKNAKVKTKVGDAIGFLSTANEGYYDAIVLKQIIHHIPPSRRKELYQLINRSLSPGGRMCILTMPESINYPMFPEAVRCFEKGQIRHDSLATGIRLAGLKVKLVSGDYPVRISWIKYAAAVRERFISDLRPFTQLQIERGLRSVSESLGNPKRLFFHDRLQAFIGIKKV